MSKNLVIHSDYISFENELKMIIETFDSEGDIVMNGERNLIKKFKLSSGLDINIKSFKKPHIINQFSYAYVRSSKAKRSFENAKRLLKANIRTPFPIAYIEHSNFLGITNSYYISKHVDYDFTYRELINVDYPNRDNVLRLFTQFTYKLHQNNIDFLDHSPGNTLIVKNNNIYDFYLIDLNRMKFRHMNISDRISNFKKLSAKDDMIKVMSEEYARITNNKFEYIFSLMKSASTDFQSKYQKRKELKSKFLGRKYS